MNRVLAIILAACLWPAAALAQSAPVVVEYYHVDALGSVRAVTNAAGAEVRRHEYAPFGEELTTVIGAGSIRFVGKERDAETGLDYSMARFYAAKWGRFTTVDPGHVGGNIFDPQSWNAYGYARNNPLRFVDPLGTWYYVETDGGSPFVINDDRDLWRYKQGGFTFSNGVIKNAAGDRVGTYLHIEDIAMLMADMAYRSKSAEQIAAAGVVFMSLAGPAGVGGVLGPTQITTIGTIRTALTPGSAGVLIGWGSGQASLTVLKQVIGGVTRASVQEMARRGLTIDMVLHLLGKYGNAMQNAHKMENNALLQARFDLMKKIYELWPK